MLTTSAVPKAGRRYTFRIRRYSLLRKLGWVPYRSRGLVFFLPPGTSKYLDSQYIASFVYGQPTPEQRDFKSLCLATAMAETSNATLPGVYWDGKNLFSVGNEVDDLKVTPIAVTASNTEFVGIDVSYSINGELCSYWLLTDRNVDMRTFYKYLLFYKRRVSVKIISGTSRNFTSMPYGKDARLGGTCSVRNLEDTPIT